MQKLKSLFISGYCTYLTLISAFSLYSYLGSDSKAMLLTAILHIIGLSFFGLLFLGKPARTSALLPKWTIPTVILGVSVAYQSVLEANTLAIVLAAIGWLGWSLYLFWYSSFGGATSQALVIGKPLPEFSLYSPAGETVTRSELSRKPTLMIFYRGNWCPLCVAQVKEISAMYSQLNAMGVDVCLVSPQPERNTQSLANRFNVPFRFLVDKELKTAEAFGIKADAGAPSGLEALGYDSDTVRPTVLITDREGTLVYSDLTDNYRVRPEPEEFIKVFQGMGLA
ncbi:peroxiredoxin family protein [Litoribrevibacter euphylliae]|uniref:Peroxiredoxin family protein n=1 Tax=Litoribrevibacter euphylliae TaxID=1834034 RepID=A0ABV7HEQ9_9GAMM